MIDHDGQPTRWARFSPKDLNGGLFWAGRGLNSLSILSYLKVAEHVSGGGAKYREAYDRLVREHSYATNVTDPKLQNGPGSGNQSDDEMAFMCFYNLLRYEQDPRLLALYNIALRRYWALEEPEACPLFNFLFAAVYKGQAARTSPATASSTRASRHPCLEDARGHARPLPAGSIRLGLPEQPSPRHCTAARPSPRLAARTAPRGVTAEPCRLMSGSSSTGITIPGASTPPARDDTLADGASFLLPYYLGLYHGFIREE